MPARARLSALPILAVALIGALLVMIQVLSYPRLSPIDELSHLDYMYRSPTLLSPGDKVGQDAMHTQACRGVDAAGFDPIRCRSTDVYDPSAYQESGYNTAATNTPIYYTADKLVAEVIRVATPADDLFIAGRAAGAVWLVLGVVLTALAGRRLGAGWLPLAAVLGVLVASPATTYANATITPDALGLAVGSGVLLAGLRWEDRPTRGRAALLVLLAGLAVLIKLTNFVIVAAVALYLLLHHVRRARAAGGTDDAEDAPVVATTDEAAPASISGRTRTVVAFATGGFALVMAAAWTLFSNARASNDPSDLPEMATKFAVDSFPWHALIDNAFTLMTPIYIPWVAVGDPTYMWFSNTVAHLLVTAGLVAAALFLPAGSRDALLARCLIIGAIVFSLGLVVLGYVTAHQYFPLPNRYGIAIVGPAAVVTAAMIRSRTALVAVSVLAVLTIASSMVRLIGLPWVPPA